MKGKGQGKAEYGRHLREVIVGVGKGKGRRLQVEADGRGDQRKGLARACQSPNRMLVFWGFFILTTIYCVVYIILYSLT